MKPAKPMCPIHLIVTCSKAKSVPVPEALQLRHLPAVDDVEQRAARWIARLGRDGVPEHPASELYRGDHWSHVREVSDRIRRSGGSITICSAGYGLVPYDAPLRPYSATFAPGQPDSVTPPGRNTAEAASAWWRTLSTWAGPCPGEPRTLADLVTHSPGGFFLVAVSEAYLRAITPDLITAIGRLSGVDRLAVLCAGAGDEPALAGHLLPCDARLQPLVGGTRTSLNVRLARKVVQESAEEDWTLPRLRKLFAGWLEGSQASPRPARRPIDDPEILRFLREALAANPSARPGPLLHLLRGRGLACQYERLVRLFREAREAADVRLF